MDTERPEAEAIAMNIVFQIGDALYDALPKDIAHKYFVTARQATNDVAIDFATKLINEQVCKALDSIELPEPDSVTTKYGYNSDEKKYGYRLARVDTNEAVEKVRSQYQVKESK